MSDFKVDTAIIGAGVVGLAIANELSKQNKESLNYLLAVAYYRTGYFDKAKAQALSLLKQNESDELYLLVAMIYESIGDIKNARSNYIKLISFYPESDYFISAKIKTRILNQH